MSVVREIRLLRSTRGDRRNPAVYSISVDPTMYYRWKESYDTFGIDGLKSHYRRMEPGVRKLMKENARLKKLLAEKDLTVEMLSEALKKRKAEKR